MNYAQKDQFSLLYGQKWPKSNRCKKGVSQFFKCCVVIGYVQNTYLSSFKVGILICTFHIKSTNSNCA